jgi:outer membrane protein OmpA-like peptidoglycan-associated protein
MASKWLFVLAAALIPAIGTASAQVLEDKTAEDIACELEGTCTNFDSTPEAAQDADSPTRGWNLASRTRTAQTQSSGSGVAAVAPRPRVRTVAMGTSTPGQRVGRRVAAPKVPGKTTLGITFARGSSALDGASLGQADRLHDALKSPGLAKARFMVGGHTDSVGNRNLNRDLSRRRAQSVVDYLVQKGLARESFEVQGFADERPLAGVTASSAVNRRVEVVKLP